MGKKSRRNRQKNPEQFKKNQENAIKKEKIECWCKRRTQGVRLRAWGGLTGGVKVRETGEPLHDPRRYT